MKFTQKCSNSLLPEVSGEGTVRGASPHPRPFVHEHKTRKRGKALKREVKKKPSGKCILHLYSKVDMFVITYEEDKNDPYKKDI